MATGVQALKESAAYMSIAAAEIKTLDVPAYVKGFNELATSLSWQTPERLLQMRNDMERRLLSSTSASASASSAAKTVEDGQVRRMTPTVVVSIEQTPNKDKPEEQEHKGNGSKEQLACPIFVILFGPPGSGKSYFAQHHLPRIKGQRYVHVSVDQVVAETPEYIQHHAILMQQQQQKDNDSSLQTDLLTLASRLYDIVRNRIGNDATDYLLERAIAGGYSIIFETTGTKKESITDWLIPTILERVHRLGYRSLLIWPVVSLTTMQRRVIARNVRDLRPISVAELPGMQSACSENFKILKEVVHESMQVCVEDQLSVEE